MPENQANRPKSTTALTLKVIERNDLQDAEKMDITSPVPRQKAAGLIFQKAGFANDSPTWRFIGSPQSEREELPPDKNYRPPRHL